jgi:hypothetical protein
MSSPSGSVVFGVFFYFFFFFLFFGVHKPGRNPIALKGEPNTKPPIEPESLEFGVR